MLVVKFIGLASILMSTATVATPARQSKYFSSAERAACAKKGGKPSQEGILQYEMCVITYKDARKKCTDHTQCGGQCIYPNDKAAPNNLNTKVTGKCAINNVIYGCSAWVQNGRYVPRPCVD